MASLTSTEIFAVSDREAHLLFGQTYDVTFNTGQNPLADVPTTAVVKRACPVDQAQIVTDLPGLRTHLFTKHKITIEPRPRARAFSWA